MTVFNFKVINPVSNRQESGTVEVSNEAQATDMLVARGLRIISLKPALVRSSWLTLSFFSRVNAKDLVAFSRQFAVMVGASVPVVEVLKTLSQQDIKPKLRRIITEISDEVDSGETLSSSLALRPNLFSNFYVSVVKAGEHSGKLDDALNYISDEMEKDYDMNSRIRGAMIYPTFVIGTMLIIGFLMMIFVVPKLTAIIVETGSQLPLATKILIATSSFLIDYWWLILALLIGLIISLRIYLKSTFGRSQFDHLILKLPILGQLLQMIYLVRFTRSMNTLIMGGVNISESLKISGEVVSNKYYQKIIAKTIIEVQSGNSICTIFAKTPEIPTMVSQMMLVGEKTGKLGLSLDKVTSFYNREIVTMLNNLMSLIEPSLMVVMGVGVGVMVAAILLPMYNVVSEM
jgi:type IV pilus assembly protein PilC